MAYMCTKFVDFIFYSSRDTLGQLEFLSGSGD